MNNIKDFINSVLADKKLSHGEQSEKVYTDEPLLFTASQMRNYTPPKYGEMRKIENSTELYAMSDVQVFYRQAKFMEDFEDDYPFNGEFFRYYPTYREMSSRQLRGYFSWRTRLRHGKIEPTSLSFAFVYIYELLNLVGAPTAEECYDKLKSFTESYGEIEPYLLRYAKQWLDDFVIYYGLNRQLLTVCEPAFSDDIVTLMHSAEHGDDEIFASLCALSSYNILNSPFYKKHPAAVQAVVCRTYSHLCEFFEAHRKNSFNEKLFGTMLSSRFYPFRAAVVFEEKKHADCVYKVSDLLTYRCENGVWYCDRFFTTKGKSKHLGVLLKYIDCAMRQRFSFKSSMKPVETTKVFSDAANRVIDEFIREKEEEKKPKIEIDVSKLQGIRDVSLITRDKLIVEEDEDEQPAAAEQAQPACESPLDETKRGFLRCLLGGENVQAFCRARGAMLSVLVDSINDEMFECFGDTVIDFDGETPKVIDDYSDELKGMLNE